MNRFCVIRWLMVLHVVSWGVASVHTAHAHVGPPRLEVQYENVPPGATFEVRGVNLVPDTSITIVLVGQETTFTLSVAHGNEHGDFTQVVELPVEAVAGQYVLQARVQDIVLVTAPLKIVGQAAAGEDEPFRDEEEPLLAPLPAGWQRSVIPTPRLAPDSVLIAEAPSPDTFPSLPLVLGGLILFIFAGVMVMVGLRAWSVLAR
ncbi:MAG: hypothetical protein ACT4QE_22200 [Anaerolineales bacterium]